MIAQKFEKIIVGTIAFIELMSIAIFFWGGYGTCDHAEHLHASWLVWQGEVPYRDFFEHHNPLLWYVMAPVVALFYKNVMIFYVARLINAFVYVIMFWGLYKISCDFLKISGRAFILALMLFFVHPLFVYSFLELSPDCFMFAGFIWGLWYYYKFLETKRQMMLNISFVLWVISFLFVQKVLFMFIIMGACTLYFMVKKEIKIKAVIKALILPLMILGLFVLYLFLNDSLTQYFTLNYELNFWMCKLKGKSGFPSLMSMTVWVFMLSAFCLYGFLKQNFTYRLLFVVLLLGDFIFKFLTWAPWVQYFVLIEFGALLIISDTILTLKTKKVACLLLFLVVCLQVYSIKQSHMKYTYKSYVKFQQYFMNHSKGNDDVIVSASWGTFNIYGKNPHYYWFGLSDIAPLAYYLYGYGGKFDINDIIRQFKPVLLFKSTDETNLLQLSGNKRGDYHQYLEQLYDKFPNKKEGAKAFADYWNQPSFYTIDDEIFDAYYQKTDKPYWFIRKDAPQLEF